MFASKNKNAPFLQNETVKASFFQITNQQDKNDTSTWLSGMQHFSKSSSFMFVCHNASVEKSHSIRVVSSSPNSSEWKSTVDKKWQRFGLKVRMEYSANCTIISCTEICSNMSCYSKGSAFSIK